MPTYYVVLGPSEMSHSVMINQVISDRIKLSAVLLLKCSTTKPILNRIVS